MIQQEYDFVLSENHLLKNKMLSNKITKNSKADILVLRANLVGIKNAKEIIKEKELNNAKIIINNYSQYSIDEQIIKNIFKKQKVFGKIKTEIKYEKILN